MARLLRKIGGTCLVIGLLGYLVVPAALWYLVRDPNGFYPCACGERPVERFASPAGAPAGYICIDAGRSPILAYQGPPLLPREAQAYLCDFAIAIGGSFILGALGLVMLVAGALMGGLRASTR